MWLLQHCRTPFLMVVIDLCLLTTDNAAIVAATELRILYSWFEVLYLELSTSAEVVLCNPQNH